MTIFARRFLPHKITVPCWVFLLFLYHLCSLFADMKRHFY